MSNSVTAIIIIVLASMQYSHAYGFVKLSGACWNVWLTNHSFK